MTTALYIVSPNDNVDAFASSARSVENGDKKAYIGKVVHAVQPIVLIDGPPMELKKKLSAGEPCGTELKSLKASMHDLLAAHHIGYDDLRIFVHFGGQSEDEVRNFNKALASLTVDEVACKCYAVSFGNKLPKGLFVDGKFSPPSGEKFYKICRELQTGSFEDFAFLRALRVLLSCAAPDENGMYDVGETCRQLLSAMGHKTISDVFSVGEREFVVANPLLCKVFNGNRPGKAINIPSRIDEQEFKLLLKTLEMEEAKQ